MSIWLVAVATVFAGAFCQGLTGFGFALIAVPLLSIAWDVKAAAAAAALLGTVSYIPLLIQVRAQVRAQVRFKPIVALLLGTAAGTPAGVAMLVVVDADALKIWVAFVVIAMSLLFAFSQRLRPRNQTLLGSMAVGTVSGLLRGSTGMGGPPVALYFLGQQMHIEGFRSTMLSYFLPAGLMVVAGFAAAGKMTPAVLTTAAVSLPSLFLGLWLGAILHYRIRPRAFQSIVLAILLFTSAAALVSVLVG